MFQFKKKLCLVTNRTVFVDSNQSRRIDAGSADVDWSSWGEDWPESHDHDDQSQWTGWSNEPTNNGWNDDAGKSCSKSSGSRNPAAEENLIDFGFGDEDRSGGKVAMATGDGWDEEVWADVDDENWEPLDTSPTKSAGKRD